MIPRVGGVQKMKAEKRNREREKESQLISRSVEARSAKRREEKPETRNTCAMWISFRCRNLCGTLPFVSGGCLRRLTVWRARSRWVI